MDKLSTAGEKNEMFPGFKIYGYQDTRAFPASGRQVYFCPAGKDFF
jgi:hypothetical protein